MPPIGVPLAGSTFTLNSSAVAGFFGGKEAISAMATVHMYEGRRWLGWFNSPGSYTVAKRFGRIANSRFWDGLFPGPNDSPAVSFGLDGKKGPEYIAALSGTKMHTGHLAYLAMERSKEMKAVKIKGRETKPIYVAYLAMKRVDYDPPVKRLSIWDALLGIIPITVSLITCLMCALACDWFSFSMILLGIVCGGYASVVIGKGRLVIKSVNNPATGSPPGHGVLMGDGDVVVIKGEERDVNVVTKGCFDLEMDPKLDDKKLGDVEKGDKKQDGGEKCNKKQDDKKQDDEEKDTSPSYHAIGVCSLLLLIQFLVQLLLVPQGTLFGQIMFVVSLGVSWGYNSYLSSLEKEKIQTNLLFDTLRNPEIRRFRVGTHTTMAVFVCLLLFHGVNRGFPEKEERNLREKILHSCLPNDTVVWRRWTKKVVNQLVHIDHKAKLLPHLQEEHDPQLSEDDTKLLNKLLKDAEAAFKGYFDVCETLPVDSSQYIATNGR